jgi:hypothetical protein
MRCRCALTAEWLIFFRQKSRFSFLSFGEVLFPRTDCQRITGACDRLRSLEVLTRAEKQRTASGLKEVLVPGDSRMAEGFSTTLADEVGSPSAQNRKRTMKTQNDVQKDWEQQQANHFSSAVGYYELELFDEAETELNKIYQSAGMDAVPVIVLWLNICL